MEETWLYSVLVCIILILYKLIIQKGAQQKNLPPSPFSLPIIGHFHLIKKPLFQTLLKLTNEYGPIVFLWLGSRPVLVLSSSSAIEECFTKNDIIFANRPHYPSRKVFDYYDNGIGAPYGPQWRNIRRITSIEIFSTARVQMSSIFRVEEIRLLIKKMFKGSFEGVRKVNMRLFFNMLSFNIIMQMLAGTRCFDQEVDSNEACGKLDDLKKLFSPPDGLSFSLRDYFPLIRWLPFDGMEKVQKLHRKRDNIMQDLIDARRNLKSSLVTDGVRKPTIIDDMLAFQESEPENNNDDQIKGIIQMMLMAGTHSSAMVMETVVSQLISHPEVLKKARDEIDASVRQSRLLDDADLAKLPYLHGIINETLRLSNMSAIIPPHESSEECTIGGYDIPQGTILMVNAWALHRDPKVWKEPYVFKPERFQESAGEKGGPRFIAFGSGRRQCPGVLLAMRLMALSLGTLIQCFEWENAREDCNLNEAENRPLEVIFRPREAITNALSQL